MLTKLTAVYTLVEQVYTGSQRALAVVALSNEVPTHLADVLRWLAVLPQRFQELRRASARARTIAALSWDTQGRCRSSLAPVETPWPGSEQL